ncbi:MAG: ribosomal L7Ae/L30e/S12e/Gadd45 family protein [archaeon]
MNTTEIKKLLGSKKNIIIGTERTIKSLKKGELNLVLVSSNCNENIINDINQYAGFSETKVEQLSMPNDELSVICKKPFSVSVIGILK